MLSGMSAQSMTPRTKRRKGGSTLLQLRWMSTRRVYLWQQLIDAQKRCGSWGEGLQYSATLLSSSLANMSSVVAGT